MNLSDRFKAALLAFVRQLVARYDYAASYSCTVLAQNGDGSLELRPESTALPGLSRVPIRYGLPGIRVRVRSGGRVVVAFENMDPTRPVATVWDEADVEELNLDTSNPNPQPIARMGDAVSVTFPQSSPFPAVGIECKVGVVGLPGLLGGPGIKDGTLQIATVLSGIITSGSPRLSA